MDDFPEFSTTSKSPKRELQGPRPTPLKVSKDSHKIRKPPVAPPPHQQQPPPRPVIIYTVSPKIIHVNPSEFMTLVQRLTGPNRSSTSSYGSSSSTSSSSAVAVAAAAAAAIQSTSTTLLPSSYNIDHIVNDAISPAARLASIEKAKCPEGRKQLQFSSDEVGMLQDMEIRTEVERTTGIFPSSILSPNPSSLPPIPPNFFSSPSDQNPMNFLHDLSPFLHSSRNFINVESGNYMPSPSNFLSPYMISPTPPLDLFNNFFEF